MIDRRNHSTTHPHIKCVCLLRQRLSFVIDLTCEFQRKREKSKDFNVSAKKGHQERKKPSTSARKSLFPIVYEDESVK